MKREAILLGIGLVGGGLGFWLGGDIARRLPSSLPITASEVMASYRQGGRWRVQELITANDTCDVVLIERRFKDDLLDKWIPADPVASDPSVVGGGIARLSIKPGQRPAWAEYDIASSGLKRGVYNVVVTATRCEGGFSDSYSLIPAVPYDFTELDLAPQAPPQPPTKPRPPP